MNLMTLDVYESTESTVVGVLAFSSTDNHTTHFILPNKRTFCLDFGEHRVQGLPVVKDTLPCSRALKLDRLSLSFMSTTDKLN